MVDSRFFQVAGPFTLEQLAEIAGARLSNPGDPGRMITNVAPLETAGPAEISFLDNPRYLSAFQGSRAGACLVDPRFADRAPRDMDLLLTETPYSAYGAVAQAFYPLKRTPEGIHETALIDPTARVGEDATIGPYSIIGPHAEIGARSRLAAQVVVGSGVVIGDDTVVGPGASISHSLIGQRCNLHAGVRIGNRGFGFAVDRSEYLDIPQLGRVIIEDDVEVGANTTIDRGTGPDTVIGAGSKIDNLVQIGHNVRVGKGCVLVAQSGIAGSTRLGSRVMLAAQGGIAGHLKIGEGARIAAKSGVMRDVAPGKSVFGYPAMPIKEYFRLVTLWKRQLRTQGKKHE